MVIHLLVGNLALISIKKDIQCNVLNFIPYWSAQAKLIISPTNQHTKYSNTPYTQVSSSLLEMMSFAVWAASPSAATIFCSSSYKPRWEDQFASVFHSFGKCIYKSWLSSSDQVVSIVAGWFINGGGWAIILGSSQRCNHELRQTQQIAG